jgi:hypothetical protein
MESFNGTNSDHHSSKDGKLSLIALVGKSNGELTDDDKYEVEGIFQNHATGWMILSPIYRTDSKNISARSARTEGKNLYVESMACEKEAGFYDPQGFYRELSERGYCLVDSKLGYAKLN